MSFRCQLCNEVNAKPVRTTLTVKPVNHRILKKDPYLLDPYEVVTGRGMQIVEEADLCATCSSRVVVEELEGEAPIEVAPKEKEEAVSYDTGAGYFEDEDYV